MALVSQRYCTLIVSAVTWCKHAVYGESIPRLNRSRPICTMRSRYRQGGTAQLMDEGKEIKGECDLHGP